jgi:hypothetical protein
MDHEKAGMRRLSRNGVGRRSALAGFEAGIRFADHEDLAAAPDDLAVTVAGFGRFEGIQDFHGVIPRTTKNGKPAL